MAHDYLIGIDEVGRGSLAGPLCVGACLAPRSRTRFLKKTLLGIKDSKKLTPQKRRNWFRTIAGSASVGNCAWSTVFVSEKVIDKRGLSFALRLAIARVLKKLNANPTLCEVLLDGGIRAPRAFLFQRTIIRGDEKVSLIAGASIMAKVQRDSYMIRLAKRFPEYGFDAHKGYGTKEHYKALKLHGISRVHRKSFLKKLQTPSTKLQISPNTQGLKIQTRSI